MEDGLPRLTGLTLRALMLADYANVRENLLNVVSAGLTRVNVSRMPASLHLYLAMIVEVPPYLTDQAHAGRILFKYPDAAETFAQATVELRANQNSLPGESVVMPMVVPLMAISFPRPGQVDLQVELEGHLAGDLSFWINETGGA